MRLIRDTQFLIQADFITQASREDVFDSPRNQKLLDGVAETFRDAVCAVCQHPSLVYDWIKYLPDDSISDGFWKRLRPKIISLLADTPILRTQSEKLLYKPARLRIVPEQLTDQNGNPLFRDLARSEIYLSQKYAASDHQKLQWLGVQSMHYVEVFDRIDADLANPNSQLKGDHMSDDWHTRVATFLSPAFSSPLQETHPALRRRIMTFPLIPLQDGSWVSAESRPLYLPATGTSLVPQDLGYNLVRPSATTLPARLQLLSQLGVCSLTPHQVVSEIISRYSSSHWEASTPHLHMHYLFENRTKLPADISSRLWVLGERREKVWLSGWRKEHMYFENPEKPYGPGALLRRKTSLFGTATTNDLLDDGVHYIHPTYLADIEKNEKHGRTFESWLEEVFGVCRIPHLTHHRKAAISNEFVRIIKHYPDKLVGLLREHWQTYKPDISRHGIREFLSASKVPVEHSQMFVALAESYLPLPKLKDVMRHAGVDAGPTFLQMPTALLDNDLGDWEFLAELGVGVRDDARLYLRALSRQTASSASTVNKDSIIPLYAQIAKRCYAEADQELIR